MEPIPHLRLPAVAGSELVKKVVGEAAKALGADPEQANRATQTLTISARADELFGFFATRPTSSGSCATWSTSSRRMNGRCTGRCPGRTGTI
jgi:hypothetical protein